MGFCSPERLDTRARRAKSPSTAAPFARDALVTLAFVATRVVVSNRCDRVTQQGDAEMDAARAGWMNQAEVALKGLRDVEGAVIQGHGDDIREIHIVTSSTRPARLIVRDVQTLLLTRFHRAIDHRVVSVAFTDAGSRPAPAE